MLPERNSIAKRKQNDLIFKTQLSRVAASTVPAQRPRYGGNGLAREPPSCQFLRWSFFGPLPPTGWMSFLWEWFLGNFNMKKTDKQQQRRQKFVRPSLVAQKQWEKKILTNAFVPSATHRWTRRCAHTHTHTHTRAIPARVGLMRQSPILWYSLGGLFFAISQSSPRHTNFSGSCRCVVFLCSIPRRKKTRSWRACKIATLGIQSCPFLSLGAFNTDRQHS